MEEVDTAETPQTLLKYFRIEVAGLTQSEMAVDMSLLARLDPGFSQSYIGKIEDGKQLPSGEFAVTLERFMRLSRFGVSRARCNFEPLTPYDWWPQPPTTQRKRR